MYYEIRYESLIANPAAECAALCSFLRLPYDEAMVRHHERRKASTSSGAATPDWRPVTQGLRDWRSQMSAEDVERFEAAAGGLLDELGYSRAVPEKSNESLSEATRVRELLAGELRTFALPRESMQVPRG